MPGEDASRGKDFDFDAIYGRSTSRWDPEKEKAKEKTSSWGPPGANIFVGGMPYSYDKAKAKELFAQHGTILSISMGKPGLAFISYKEPKQASCAIVALDSLRLEGRTLSVIISKDQCVATDASDSENEEDEDSQDDANMPPLSFSGRTTKAEQVMQARHSDRRTAILILHDSTPVHFSSKTRRLNSGIGKIKTSSAACVEARSIFTRVAR
jgi:RNA recognition motif-containing protein